MAKKVRAEAAAGNGPMMPPARATAAGKMLGELLCLDTGDAGAVEAFTRRHGLYHATPARTLAHAASLLKAAVAELDGSRHRAAEVFAAARACFAIGADEGRAGVRRDVGRMIFRRCDVLGWIGALAQHDPRFNDLCDEQGRAFVKTLIARARQKKKTGRKVSPGYVAAALSLRVHAFDDAQESGETEADACRRVKKLFEQACARTEAHGRTVPRKRKRGTKSVSAAANAAANASKTAT